MSIEYNNALGLMTVFCDAAKSHEGLFPDECDEVLEVYGLWDHCIEQVKEEGWIIEKKDDWMHYCPECNRYFNGPQEAFK